MDKDIRVIEDMKCHIEKGRSNFRKSPRERITEPYILARMEGLEDMIQKFTAKHEYLISAYSEKDLNGSSYVLNDVYNVAYETYLTYKGELKSALMSIKPSYSQSNSSDSPEVNKMSVVNLPKISIPTFSGNYMEWSSFKDLFTSLVCNNPSLDDVQRLHYLKTQVQGEAEQLIKHIPITQANFKKCWDMLKGRYDNKRYMSNCILKRLFSQRPMNSESSNAIKDLLDTTSNCIHELSNLGIKVETWDIMIIYIVSSKLDVETRKQWELNISNFSEDLPTFSQFQDFLESRFRALEFVEPSKNKYKSGSNAKVMHVTSNPNVTCPHCHEHHRIYSCVKFANEDVNERQNIVKSLGLCFNCLGTNHTGKFCRVSTKCRICKAKHHTLLHGKSNPLIVGVVTEEPVVEDDEEPESSVPTNETSSIANYFVTGEGHTQTLLATALIKAESHNGYPQILRALLDQGSQGSFISEAAVQLLRLKKITAKSNISGLGGDHSGLTSQYVVMVNIQSICDPTFKLQVKAHVLSTVTSILPERKFTFPHWTELGRINLADPQYNSPNKIDILLGSEVYCRILKEGLIRNPSGHTIAQDTCLGWILSGRVEGHDDTEGRWHNIVNLHINVELDELLKKFWQIESDPKIVEPKVLSPEEQACEDNFNKTTCRDSSGRYIVHLPFRPHVEPNYGDTRSVAVQRLKSLEKRLSKNAQQKQDYSEVIEEYLTLGHMEEADRVPANIAKTVWLPHHAVIRMDKSTTKTRVVFNASSRCGGNTVSLNDTLMIGPTLQSELRHIIMRWRLYPICLSADIIKMYRQVRIAKEHADFQRLVWRAKEWDSITDYKLLTVTFGTSSAPYLAVKALQQVAIDEGHTYPLAAERVKTDFYMDDLLTGCQSETEAIKIYKEMTDLLKKGGFTLQKWTSNRIGLLDFLTEDKSDEKEIKEDEITKVVGLTWNRRSDHFTYNIKWDSNSSAPNTKRGIVSEICRLYDPLGWISPCIVTAKIFIQNLWLTGLDWDQILPEELSKKWAAYRLELLSIVNFYIPRWMHTSQSDEKVELHGFSDASNSAYAAVVYVRCISKEGIINTHLVTAKTKVAPIKQVSTPRLELCGAVLVAKLLLEVSEIFKVEKSYLHAWTDSTIVLAWLSDHPSRWKTFVANRTSQILNMLDSSQYSYVQSHDNPADCASRGISASELIENKLWKYGPDWLHKETISYGKPRSILTKTELEAKTIKAHNISVGSDQSVWIRFSTFRRLLRVVAYCRRILLLKESTETRIKPLPYLTSTEIQESSLCCVRQHQAHFFAEDVTAILKNKYVSKSSKLSTLNPFIDRNGILRVGGRIINSDLPNSGKHPMIIDGKSHLAKLIIRDAHEKTLHGGQQITCNYVRYKYWIVGLKNVVRAHIHECISCIRNAAKTRSQLMGQLPSCRVTPNKPFLYSGVDYAGPISMRVSKGRGQRAYKGYICLFVCMCTRAIHIEAVSDLTSEGFLSAFKRFVARRGRCVQLWSDNGTNFIGAARELKRLLASERSSFPRDVASSLASNGTEWRFIPPHAPNFGGLWEAGIKSTKHHLRRVIGDTTLTYEEMSTVLTQIEACLNSRPLSQISSDSDDVMPLTPGHFLVGEPLVMAPDHNLDQITISPLRRWQLTQRMVQHFWKRWYQEYLVQFFQRYKWKTLSTNLKRGDVVIVKEDNLPPTKWLYGRIVEVHPGRDNVTRVVTLRCKDATIQRPASKLCPLPVSENKLNQSE